MFINKKSKHIIQENPYKYKIVKSVTKTEVIEDEIESINQTEVVDDLEEKATTKIKKKKKENNIENKNTENYE